MPMLLILWSSNVSQKIFQSNLSGWKATQPLKQPRQPLLLPINLRLLLLLLLLFYIYIYIYILYRDNYSMLLTLQLEVPIRLYA